MDEYIAVYLTDVKMAIEELESYFNDYPRALALSCPQIRLSAT